MVLAPSDDRHLAGEERRIANDGGAYTFHEFVAHYGEHHGTAVWNEASADAHRAGDGGADGALEPYTGTRPSPVHAVAPLHRPPSNNECQWFWHETIKVGGEPGQLALQSA